ncbi:MAG: DUF371 domain-containing protein [Halobacteriaceae archaeon]
MDESITAHGHTHVAATHESTLELTTDDYLTPAGDCIVGIEADRAPSAFDRQFIEACQHVDATIELELEAAGHRETVTGRGDPALTFDSGRSLVCRASEYIDERTVMVEADTAAADLDRPLVEALAGGTVLRARLSVE